MNEEFERYTVNAIRWSQPQFIGWAPMERIFVGYRKK
jgi:hypothetical protein